jgi:hypothetical protein
MRSNLKLVAACVATAVAVGATTATAATLITGAKVKNNSLTGLDIKDIKSGDLKDGSIRLRDLHAEVLKAIQTGNANAGASVGNTGSAGAPGSAGANGTAGTNGTAGANGTNGTNGANGANPATAVGASGDAGWSFVGAPAARLIGGELRLGGGFDASTPSGAIGIAKPFSSVPLGNLSALSYSYHINKRPPGNTVSAPTIHVTLTGANRTDGTASGFTNLVFEPYLNETVVTNNHDIDAQSGQWWSTRAITGSPDQATTRTLAQIVADNPNAVIQAISLDNGGSSSNTIPVADFDAGADNLVVGFGSTFDRYDFGG